MDICIYSSGLPHAERTLELKSLGGSETAALMVAKNLAQAGHCVTLFSRHPAQGEPDHVQDGHIGADGVRYMTLEKYAEAVTSAPLDVLIVSRDPGALALPHQANKAVLWCHDLATEPFNQALKQVEWNIDEIWTVSEFHRYQVHEVTGFGLSHIIAMRNGIIDVVEPEIELERDPKLLYYGSRPERGLAHLVAPGGIMERLPDYRLQFSIYGDPSKLPEHVQQLYQQIFEWAQRLPNVEFLGQLTQTQVRHKLAECAALVYPSDFEETSCILAREAISVSCPIIASDCGAMPETVKDCGYLMPARREFSNEEEFAGAWAGKIRHVLEQDSELLEDMARACKGRKDLSWDGVSAMIEQQIRRRPIRPALAQAQAMVEIGDVIPAITLLELPDKAQTKAAKDYLDDLRSRYATVLSPDAAQAYQARYKNEPPTYGDLRHNKRFGAVAAVLSDLKLPDGAVVLDYGCCEGNQLLNLALAFPKFKFVGYDHASFSYRRAHEAANSLGVQDRVSFTNKLEGHQLVDVVLLTELLEHTVKPWEVIDHAESLTNKGGHIITTTPIGPWEARRIFRNRKDYDFPEHLWHLDKAAMETMCRAKRNFRMTYVPYEIDDQTMLILGNLLTTWQVDRRIKTRRINEYTKIMEHTPRLQTCAVAMIAMNEEHDILRMLKSCEREGIRDFAIALGPSTDGTAGIIEYFRDQYPWCRIQIKHVPPVHPPSPDDPGFGFDDARNAALDMVRDDFDWVLWIDCDEELIGSPRRFMRNNHFDSYAICQHHFTVDPRGTPAQIDRPARFIRPARGFRFIGKVHEHAELGHVNSGPGRSMVLPAVDLFHIGYKNEEVRKRRFWRNLPFLQWDRDVNPDRNLGKYLWLRDLVHQMRYSEHAGDKANAVSFAEQAIDHYNETWQDMVHFGNGLVQGFQYVSEARRFLNRGIPVQTQVRLDENRAVMLQGQVEDPDELTRLIGYILKDECDKSRSKYR